jgi:hypothetical protein
MPTEQWENPTPPQLDGAHVLQVTRTKFATDTESKHGTVVTMFLPDSMAASLAAATTGTATTPLAVDARAIARPIGLALQTAVADGMELP